MVISNGYTYYANNTDLHVNAKLYLGAKKSGCTRGEAITVSRIAVWKI